MITGLNATILRDAYGVPHIFAGTEADALRGFGYAQAGDRLTALLAHYLAGRGEAASVLGAAVLERDVAVRAFRLPEIAASRYTDLPPELRVGIEAFADGVNRYQSDHPEKCPPWAFVVSPTDVVSLALTYNLFFATDHFETDDPAENVSPHPTSGSNGFAVAKQRTANGNALVSLDPHLPIDGFLRWYEARVSGGAMDVYGVAFVGTPYMAMGTNGRVAWANTVNAPDLSDLYEIRLRDDPGKPLAYEYDGGTRPCDVRTYAFSVRHGDGVRSVRQRIVSTHHGPILRQVAGKRYAVRKAGVGDVQMLTQVRAQCLAGDVEEYRAALSGCHLVMFNHLFGDAKGDIGYVSAGAVPRRPLGYDFHGPVPGWTSATEWGDNLTIDELPQAIRPPSGFAQNCNDSPAHCGAGTEMQVGPPYPEWLAPDVRTLRADRLFDLLRNGGVMTPESAMETATDCADLNARRELAALCDLSRDLIPPIPLSVPERGELIAGGVRLAGATDAARFSPLRDGEGGGGGDVPGEVLRLWDGSLRSDAKGATLFHAWLQQPFVRTRLPVGGYRAADYATVAPLAERFPDECARALEDAAEWLRAYGYPLDVEWGVVHRLRRGDIDLPSDGGLDSLVPNGGRINEADGVTTVSFGSSFRCVVELTPEGVPRIWACLPWGNSDDSKSPHYADQLPLAARRGYRVVPWTREAVEAEATARL